MRVLRVRVIVLLCLVYLSLVCLLYQFLWRTHGIENSIDSLFDSPGQGNSPQISNDVVQFNFKRHNGPALQDNNGTLNILINRTALPEDTESEFKLPRLNKSLSFDSVESPLLFDVAGLSPPNYCIHAFYYLWYGNSAVDGEYRHWNHKYLPHWKKEITAKYPQGRHKPPDDIGASFYPELGCYSSSDPRTMEAHVYQFRKAGIGIMSVSWYPEGMSDDEGGPPDELIPELLNIAHKYGVKITLHIEPYKNRTPLSVRKDLEYIHKKYLSHPAFFKLKRPRSEANTETEESLPLIYVYDSYLSSAKEWGDVLKVGGASSIRGSKIDAVVLGLLVDRKHKQAIVEGGFDGFYTYFASDRFSFGSTIDSWGSMELFAREKGLMFVPSFGPGYNDERVRPWNKPNSKPRQNGSYYRKMFAAAVRSGYLPGGVGGSKIVSLTSFNEWHEGTQIESAVPKTSNNLSYLDYHPHGPDFYLELTLEGSLALRCSVL